MMRKSGDGTSNDEEGVRFSLRLTLVQSHAHVQVSAAFVCPARHSVSVGRLGEGERSAQQERYLKQKRSFPESLSS